MKLYMTFIELSVDTGLEKIFKTNKNVCQFQIKVQNKCSDLAEKTLKMVIPFSTTYLLTEQNFSQ